jgi:hypothetical protein
MIDGVNDVSVKAEVLGVTRMDTETTGVNMVNPSAVVADVMTAISFGAKNVSPRPAEDGVSAILS